MIELHHSITVRYVLPFSTWALMRDYARLHQTTLSEAANILILTALYTIGRGNHGPADSSDKDTNHAQANLAEG